MKDPREAKLPKWAVELLEAERLQAALSWPDVERPEPVWQPGVNTYAPRDLDGQEVWLSIPTSSGPKKGFVVGGFIYSGPEKVGFGCRPEHGRYFATERAAWVDMWWARAENAAALLHAAKQGAESAMEGRNDGQD